MHHHIFVYIALATGNIACFELDLIVLSRLYRQHQATRQHVRIWRNVFLHDNLNWSTFEKSTDLSIICLAYLLTWGSRVVVGDDLSNVNYVFEVAVSSERGLSLCQNAMGKNLGRKIGIDLSEVRGTCRTNLDVVHGHQILVFIRVDHFERDDPLSISVADELPPPN